MICRDCTKNFKPFERDKHLVDSPQFHNSTRCLDCLIKNMEKKRSIAYFALKLETIKHNALRAKYYQSSRALEITSTTHRDLDYKINIIKLKVRQEKEAKLKTPKPKSTKKVTAKAVAAILATLSKDQREKILAQYKK